MEQFLGLRYRLVKKENFSDLLYFLEKNFIERHVAASLTPTQYLTKNEGETYTLHFDSAVINYNFTFKPGEEFKEKKPDGVVVQSIIKFEGSNKLLHTQRENSGRQLDHIYEFHPDKMTITTTGKGLKSVVKRHYVAVQ